MQWLCGALLTRHDNNAFGVCIVFSLNGVPL